MGLYRSQTIEKYLKDLAAKLPAPGGGSAAALGAALGVSLVSMVVNFTLGKPRYAKYEARLKDILASSEKLRKRFLELVDADVSAYKSRDVKKSLQVPLEVAELCIKAIALCPPLVKQGNVNLISDVAVAAALLEAAYASAVFNVDINLKYLSDKRLSSRLNRRLSRSAGKIRKIRLETEEKVGEIIRG